MKNPKRKAAKPGPVIKVAPAKAGSILRNLPVGPIRPKPGSLLIAKAYRRTKGLTPPR